MPSHWRSRLESVRCERTWCHLCCRDMATAGLAGRRMTALWSWVLSVPGDVLSWIRRPTWHPGLGGPGCWDLGAGAWWHSAAGHSRRVTHGGRSDKELGRQQWGEDPACHLLPHLDLLVNPLPGAAVRRMTQELCWLWCCSAGMLLV